MVQSDGGPDRPGRITHCHKDGTYTVTYPDPDKPQNEQPREKKIDPVRIAADIFAEDDESASDGGGGGGGAASSSAARQYGDDRTEQLKNLRAATSTSLLDHF